MCLGGGGMMQQPQRPKPVQQPGPESPPDMVNDQVIPNANEREPLQQGAHHDEWKNKNKPKPQSQSSLPNY